MQRMSIAIAASILMLGGCATKKYVAQTVDPVKAQVQQVDTSLDQTRKQLEQDEKELSATTEKANAADSRANEALKRADTASQKAEQVGNQVRSELRGELQQVVANLDDYREAGATTVQFAFNSDKLTTDGEQGLDQLVTSRQASLQRYFITVEGFTDRIGSDAYNNELSRRRANSVVRYLVAKHSIPVYRIHVVGLGKLKPADEARSRAANAKNRRVEVTIYTAQVGAPAAQRQP